MVELLSKWRRANARLAEELDIDGSLIAPRASLEAIAGAHEGAEEQLLNWQRKLLGI